MWGIAEKPCVSFCTPYFVFIRINYYLFKCLEEAQFNSKVPLNELPKIPRQAYVSQEFLQYEGSGGPNDTKITDKVYMFVNKTSGRLSAVKVLLYGSNSSYDNVRV